MDNIDDLLEFEALVEEEPFEYDSENIEIDEEFEW